MPNSDPDDSNSMSGANPSMREMLRTMPQVGRVRWIGLRTERQGPVIAVPAADLSLEQGLVGDHFSGPPGAKRQVTLIQYEHLAVMAPPQYRRQWHKSLSPQTGPVPNRRRDPGNNRSVRTLQHDRKDAGTRRLQHQPRSCRDHCSSHPSGPSFTGLGSAVYFSLIPTWNPHPVSTPSQLFGRPTRNRAGNRARNRMRWQTAHGPSESID